MVGKISEDPDKVVDGTEKVGAVSGGNNFGILISSIRTWIVSTLTKSSVGLSNVDNTADATKPVSTAMLSALDLKQSLSAKGSANGYAGLDSAGKVPAAQLPDATLGALTYAGTWNANTNSPTIPAASSGNKGWYFMVATEGATSIGGITDWKVGDWLVSNGATWDKIDNTDAVNSVAGLTGAIGAAALRIALNLVIGTDVAAQSHVGSGGSAHAKAVAGGAAGFMSGADKTKVDSIPSIAPTCSVTRGGTDQAGIVSNTFTKVQLTTEDFDNNNNFDSTTNYRFTPSVAGKYLVSAQVVLISLAAGVPVLAAIRKNGVTVRQGFGVSGGYIYTPAGVTAPIDMNGSSDYLEMFVYHEQGANRDLWGASAGTFFSATRVGS